VLPHLAADALVVVHLAFIGFALFGALLAARWRAVIIPHLAAMAWAIFVEMTGSVCPLTPLENQWRIEAGLAGYPDGFVDHYLLPGVYPAGLTPNVRQLLAVAVVVVNVVLYGWLLNRIRSGTIDRRRARSAKRVSAPQTRVGIQEHR